MTKRKTLVFLHKQPYVIYASFVEVLFPYINNMAFISNAMPEKQKNSPTKK